MTDYMFNIGFSVFGILFGTIPIIINILNKRQRKVTKYDGSIYGSWWSIQHGVVIVGIILLILLPWVTSYFFNDFENLSNDGLKYFLSATMTGVYALVAGFGIVLSILWGALFGFYVKKDMHVELYKLRRQSIILFLLLIWLLISIFFTIIKPIIGKIT